MTFDKKKFTMLQFFSNSARLNKYAPIPPFTPSQRTEPSACASNQLPDLGLVVLSLENQ